MDVTLSTFAFIVAVACVFAYRIPFLHNKTVAYLSLLQILYLIIMPGFVAIMVFSEMRRIMARPLVDQPFLPDGLLANIILLSLMFTYGGLAIHAVTKMLSTNHKLRFDISEVGQMNKFFHLQFSHNLIYGGTATMLLSFAFLELNHSPPGNYYTLWSSISKGIILAVSLMVALYTHTQSKDNYVGKWSDFKALFMIIWAGLVLLLYGIKKLRPDLVEYELILPAIVSWAILSILGLVLVFRRVKKGGYIIRWRWRRLID